MICVIVCCRCSVIIILCMHVIVLSVVSTSCDVCHRSRCSAPLSLSLLSPLSLSLFLSLVMSLCLSMSLIVSRTVCMTFTCVDTVYVAAPAVTLKSTHKKEVPVPLPRAIDLSAYIYIYIYIYVYIYT